MATTSKSSNGTNIPSEPSCSNSCVVCSEPAHGIHFGVLACRACAAFFRRTIVKNQKHECLKGDMKCTKERKDVKLICRLCRYNRCLEQGMVPDNIQLNRDALSSTKNKQKKDKESQKYIEEAASSSRLGVIKRKFAQDKQYVKKYKHTIESGSCNVARNLENIFSTFDPENAIPEIRNQTLLTRMNYALLRHRKNQNPNPRKIDRVDIECTRPYWEIQMYRVAEWMTFCKGFAEIPTEDKMTLFINRWRVWRTVERLQMSLEIFGPNKVLKEYMLLLTDEFCTNMKEFKIDMSVVSDYDSDYLKSIFDPLVEKVFDEAVRPLINLQLTSIEFTYMLCLVALHIEALPVKDITQDICVRLRDELSRDLHNYYMSKLQYNYAGKLVTIMHVIDALEKVQRERANLMELAQIFDIIRIDICEGHCGMKL